MKKMEVSIPYDRVIVSDMLPAWKVSALHKKMGEVPLTLSEYMEEKRMSLSYKGKFTAMVAVEDFIDEE